MRTTWRRRLSRETFPKARERAARAATPDLLQYAEGHLIYAGQALGLWRRGGGDPALDDVDQNLLALIEISRELRARSA